MLRASLRYLAVGVFNTIVGLGTIFICKWAAAIPDVPANAIGYGVGIIVSFFANRRWTFGHDGPRMHAFLRFLSVLGVAYLANLGTVLFCIDTLGLNSYLAHAVGVGPYTVLGFLGSKLYAFKTMEAGSGNGASGPAHCIYTSGKGGSGAHALLAPQRLDEGLIRVSQTGRGSKR